MPQTLSRYALAAALLLAAAKPAAAIDPPAVARLVEPSMVRVFVESPLGAGSASGFVINDQGYVATIYHVVEPHVVEEWDLFVVESGGAPDTRRAATVVKAYPEEDLAILKVEGLERPPVTLSEADEEVPAKGSSLFAIGYPGAGERLGGATGSSFTAGMANRLFVGAWTPESARIRIIQHSAATNPGNSGGPIVDPCGQVVGVNTEREMAVLMTPAGLPLVFDVIQGVFFASHVSVLIEKLKELNIPYRGSYKTCRVILGVASTNFPWYGAAALAALLILAALFIKHWPRQVVHVVVLGGHAARDSARAVTHILPLHWRHRNGGPGWRLIAHDAEGRPVELVITRDRLRGAREGLVIGCDADCDLKLPLDGVEERHARLVPLGRELGVVDLHSRGGTKVGEQRVAPGDGAVALKPGAKLKLGDVTLEVESR